MVTPSPPPVSQTNAYIAIPLISICAVICTISTLVLLYQAYCQNTGNERDQILSTKTKPYFNFLLFICFLASTLCEYCDLTRWIIAIKTGKGLFFTPLNQSMAIANFFHQVGAFSFYIIAMARVYDCCKTTYYPINKRLMIGYTFFIVIGSITAMYYVIIVAIQPPHDTYYFFPKYNTPAMIMLMIIDFLLNATLFILFIYKLNQLLTQRLIKDSIYSFGSIDDNGKTQCDIDLIIRYSVLFTFAIITNQLFFTANMVNHVVDGVSDHFHWIIYCFRGIENAANCVVLLLALNGNHPYYLVVCGKCHSSLVGLFTVNTENVLMNMKLHYDEMEREIETNCEQTTSK